jgi:hypothetical protein
MPSRTRQTVGPTALAVWRKGICWAGGRIPSTHLRRVAVGIYGWPTDLCRWCELTLRSATRGVAGITHSITEELASLGVATRRVGALARIALFSALYDAVSTHVESDCPSIWVRIRETASVQAVLYRTQHQRT